MLWRNSNTPDVYQQCQPMQLAEGLLMSHDFSEPAKYIQQAVYHQSCLNGATPYMYTNVNILIDKLSENLPLVEESWKQYTRNPESKGSFLFSVAPIVYSMATSAVITWFLTIFVLTNYMIKPSSLLKVSVMMASIFMLIVIIKSIVVLHQQQRQGYLHGDMLLKSINQKVYLQVIDLLVTFCLQINQVQIIMRLFSRQSDKRIIFLVGLILSIASQTLWSISKFHPFGDSAEAGKIIPAFTYLIRISMSITYAAIFTAFVIIKVKILMLNPSMWVLSLLTLVLIYAPVAFFISDVSSSWMYDLSEIFSTVTYVVCVVIPWEWCNKYNVIRKKQEKEGVLGRKFYEDELYELDKYELFVEEDSDDDSHNSHKTHRSNQSSISQRSIRSDVSSVGASGTPQTTSDNRDGLAVKDKLSQGYVLLRDRFFKVTDFIIATGMAIPRSVSAGSPIMGGASSHLRQDRNQFYVAEHSSSRPSPVAPVRTSERRTGDVFVYGTKDMNISLDD